MSGTSFSEGLVARRVRLVLVLFPALRRGSTGRRGRGASFPNRLGFPPRASEHRAFRAPWSAAARLGLTLLRSSSGLRCGPRGGEGTVYAAVPCCCALLGAKRCGCANELWGCQERCEASSSRIQPCGRRRRRCRRCLRGGPTADVHPLKARLAQHFKMQKKRGTGPKNRAAQ